MKRRTFYRFWGGLLMLPLSLLIRLPVPQAYAEVGVEPTPTPVIVQILPVATPEPASGEDAQALAKLIAGYADIWDGIGDARTVELQARALCWTVLNRVDDPAYPDTVEEVITQRAQFDRYDAWNRPTDEQLRWARETVSAWKKGGDRVLPEGYLYIKISGGSLYFSQIYRFEAADCWTWSLPLPAETALSDAYQG